MLRPFEIKRIFKLSAQISTKQENNEDVTINQDEKHIVLDRFQTKNENFHEWWFFRTLKAVT